MRRTKLDNIYLTGVVDFSFASYPASMVAAGSLLAAVGGILGRSWMESFQLITQLQRITTVDAVCSHCHFTE